MSFEKADEVEKFFETVVKEAPAAKRAMKQCVENIRKYAGWRKNDIEFVEKWCKTQG